MAEMAFDGSSSCPEFVPNTFKKDICQNCQHRVQSHGGATQQQIKAALEFAVDRGDNMCEKDTWWIVKQMRHFAV